MRPTVSRTATTALATSLLLLTGCTTVYPGVGVRNPHADQNVNVSLLDTGNFPTKPSEPLGTAKTREAGALVEARRLADVVTVPFEADPALTKSGGAAGAVTIGNDIGFSYFSEDTGVGVAITNAVNDGGLITGFKTNAESEIGSNGLAKLKHVVVRFATPEDATKAVDAMADHAEHEATEYNPPRQAQPIPDRPEIRAFSSSDEDKRSNVFTFVAHGTYALIDFAEVAYRKTNLDDAIRLATTTIDKQIPPLDGFQATPVDKLADLEIDPSGLQARTLPIPKNASSSAQPGVYGAHGALHFMANPQRSQKTFDDTGMTELSRAGATVYQARDENSAKKLADDIVAEIGGMKYPSYLPDDPISNLPGSKCLKPDGDSTLYAFRCVVSVDRYVIEIGGPSAVEARRMASAQYVMLTAK
ncbi:DUF7373 family lipoprotein [Mycolicibacillus trivialis]|uniref:DUF7373 family lipoprotein n=1 Tax=Mycolicibacillus trivialis TaxID=1798 RepID=UPI0021F27D31|nr:hypothetical protein [Mycolicibacillus trivialis]